MDGNGFAVHYAPFDHINIEARVVLVGLTPGWQQTRLAVETARDRLRAGDSDETVLWAVKQQASFAGMRDRLAQWLDGIGVASALRISSAAELFSSWAQLLQTTSAIRYPVFCPGDTNWSGTNPSIAEPALRDLVRRALAPELESLPGALVVPLGVAVQTGLHDLVERDELDPSRCLFGFPHPSGANATGPRRYAEARQRLSAVVDHWAGRPVSAKRPSTSPRISEPTLTEPTPTARSNASPDEALPARSVLQGLMLDALAALGGCAQRHAIKRKATELGPFSRAQLAIPAPPSKRGQYPNQLSYQLDWALNALHRQHHVRHVGPGEWALR
jgi:hypothetical protein